ncbi:hypothetical protein TanjilG_32271 [Lupinus angustifolius]|uniref:TIR domain-containing protein n=1 Tax=Lupinus angustifolius TaxID=3871 RepID=A0A4P1R080_LUPAN|nr:hypothetical protein TanjilG_32271 [Lupinus angustifolius]
MTSKGGSCQISQWKYHVFLSFRGGDTRKSFTDHLYAALNRKGILVFRDGEQLLRGEVISQQLLHAIQQSLTSVVVISPDYASSTWCLEELHNILESTRVLGRKAFPVFYGVDPSHVRYQSGNLAESFRKLEQRFSADLNKVQKWRNALRGVANLSGWDSRDRHETELIEDIVGEGTESTEGIIVKSSDPHEEHWDPEAFSKMYNLKVLIILCDLHLPLGLKCLSSSLKILEWESCSLRELPLGLPLDELVHLKMHCSKFNQLWSGTKHFRKLKSIDLTDSRDLIRTPDIFEVPCLERLVLKGCKNIVEVHQSVAQHKHLLELNLECCINLKTLPRKLEMDALKELILSGCSQVKKLPEFGKSMVYLSILSLKDCKSLICLPQSIRNLKSLIKLDIQGCSKLFGLPNNLNENNVVEEVEVNETTRREAPLSLSDFKALVTLLSKGCDWLSSKSWSISLPADEVFGCKQYPLSMDLKFSPLLGCSMLKSLNLAYCNLSDGSIPNDIGQLSALEKLILNGNNFAHLPACIQKLHRLKWLELNDCPRLGTLPLLPPAVTCLTLQNCTQLAPISFDSRRIWNILDARRRELKYGLWFMVPGSEIPPWFENEDYVLAEANLLDPDYGEKYDFLASKLVDIHNHYSCPCAGIALCLSLESPMIFSHKCLESITVDWSLKDPPKFHPLQPGTGFRTYFKGRHLLIKILRRGGVFMPYAWGDKKVELKITGKNLCGCRKLKLRGFGSRVIYEDDQWWQRDEEADEDEINVSSVSVQYGINLKQSRIAEIIDNLECDELRRKHYMFKGVFAILCMLTLLRIPRALN